MKLVDNWKDGWKWISVHALVILTAIPLVWASIPADWKALIPSDSLAYIALAAAACGIVARLFREGRLSLSNLGGGKSWFSVWALFFAGAIPLIWQELPASMISELPQQAVTVITSIVSALGLIGRFIDQSSKQVQAVRA